MPPRRALSRGDGRRDGGVEGSGEDGEAAEHGDFRHLDGRRHDPRHGAARQDEKLPLPAAIAPGTPWSDIDRIGDTYKTNEWTDNILVTWDGWLGRAAKLYANGHDLKDPYISPIYGDFSNFPPTILTSGTRDLFLSNTVRTHRKLRRAGVIADLNVYEGMSHAQYQDVNTPESRAGIHRHRAVLRSLSGEVKQRQRDWRARRPRRVAPSQVKISMRSSGSIAAMNVCRKGQHDSAAQPEGRSIASQAGRSQAGARNGRTQPACG